MGLLSLDEDLVQSLTVNPAQRNHHNIQSIYAFLRRLDSFSRLADQPLRVICRNARCEFHKANEILFRKNQLSTCWYVLLSGSVFIGGQMYLPRDNFGKRTGNSNRRASDCIVLEPSEMIVIDYPDVTNVPTTLTDNQRRRAIASMNLDHVILPPNDPKAPQTVAQSSAGSSTGPGGSSTIPPSTSTLLSRRHYHHHIHNKDHVYPPPASSAGSSQYAGALSSCEQLREVETVIQRSEVFLTGGQTTTAPLRPHGSGPPTGAGSSPNVLESVNPSSSSLTTVESPISKFFARSSFRRNSSATSADRLSTSTHSSTHTTTGGDCDDELADLPEANVDSDEEDDESCPSGDSFMELRDNVRECLEKDPADRTEEDVHVLLDFMQHMPAFANLPVRVKRELCWKMVFAVVEKAYTTVMRDGEQLDSWSVIVNGEVEVLMPDGSKVEYHLGDSFGVEPRPEPQFHSGQMRTVVDDCQFVLVAQHDYMETISKASDNLRKHTDAAGEIISETEKRTLENNREGYVLIKGKPDKLVQALIEDRDTSVDQYYVEDFLLMYRTFMDSPVEIMQKFLHWFNNEPNLREKVARLVILWVNNHFNDFETESQMMNLLDEFEQALEKESMNNHQQLLNIACSVKSRTRTVIYTRSNRDEMLHFSILGANTNNTGSSSGSGSDKQPVAPPPDSHNYGIFISKVEPNSQAEKVGLKRGDQILEVNGKSFQSSLINYQKAVEILRGSTHLSITVKSNLLGFKEMLSGDFQAGGSSLVNRPDYYGGGGRLNFGSIDTTQSPNSQANIPRTKSYGARKLPVGCLGTCKQGSVNLPPTLHHTQSYIDAKYFAGLALNTSSTNRSLIPNSPTNKTTSGSGGDGGGVKETSRLSKLIRKIKHGNSSSSLPMDDDRPDGGIFPVNYNPSISSAATSIGSGSGSFSILAEFHGHLRLKHSRSNPDIPNQLLLCGSGGTVGSGMAQQQQQQFAGISKYYQPARPPCPEHVLKIYRSDQTFKYLTVYKETNAQQIVQLALQEFGMASPEEAAAISGVDSQWSLCEVSVSLEGFIKQRRLPDQMQNLAERIALNSRYYLKNNKTTETLVSDELAPELLKESQTNLTQLTANILAAQMTLQDFSIFASIEPTEYVDNLFQNIQNSRKSKYGWPKLEQFEQLVNKEMWWVATEVCRERNLLKRSKIVKKFIKVARQCRDFKNFNSMFAVVSGLEKPCVRRLHATWDKVSTKYTKIFEDLQLLLDPSRNMSKYRQHLAQMSLDPPVIPLFPVIRKDLYFIHECNPTFSDGLVNFEKLRMIAKEIRTVTKLASAPYELTSMFDQCGRINDALLYMNSFEGGPAVATMRKQFNQRGPLSRKKLYEQALMVRRVKSYLSNLVVIDNENELDKLSLECESQPASSLNTSLSSRRRLPSPSPSNSSSNSHLSELNRRLLPPKFGVESPHAVQRMLALVDHSRMRNQQAAAAAGGIGLAANRPSPATSPCAFRRKVIPNAATTNASSCSSSGSGCSSSGSGGGHHGRSQSESIPQGTTVLPPVDLTAECSSVNILISPLRLHSSGSVTSTDSGLSQQGSVNTNISHAVSCDSTDSGHCSMLDAAHVGGGGGGGGVGAGGVGGAGSAGSPPNQRRSYPLNQQARCYGPKGYPHQGTSSGGGHAHHHHYHQATPSACCSSSSSQLGTILSPSIPGTPISGADTLVEAATTLEAADCQQQSQQVIRRTNSIPTNNSSSKGSQYKQDGEQVSRV